MISHSTASELHKSLILCILRRIPKAFLEFLDVRTSKGLANK